MASVEKKEEEEVEKKEEEEVEKKEEVKKSRGMNHSCGLLALPDDCMGTLFPYLTVKELRCVVISLSHGLRDCVRGRMSHLVSISHAPRRYTSLLGRDVAVRPTDEAYAFFASEVYKDTEAMAVEQDVPVPDLKFFPRLRRFRGTVEASSASRPPLTLEEWQMYSAPPFPLSTYSTLTTLHVLEDTVVNHHLLSCPPSLTSLHLKSVEWDTPTEALHVFQHLSSLCVLHIDHFKIQIPSVSAEEYHTTSSTHVFDHVWLLTPFLLRLVELKLPFDFFNPPAFYTGSTLRFLPPSTLPSSIPPVFPRLRCLHLTVSLGMLFVERAGDFLQLVSPTLTSLQMVVNKYTNTLLESRTSLLGGLQHLSLKWRSLVRLPPSPTSTRTLFHTLVSRYPLRDLELRNYPPSHLDELFLSPLRATLTTLTLHIFPHSSPHNRSSLHAETELLLRLPTEVPLLSSFSYTGSSLDTLAAILPRWPNLSRISITPSQINSLSAPLVYPHVLLTVLSELPSRVTHLSLYKRCILESLRKNTRWQLCDTPPSDIPPCRCRQIHSPHRWTCPPSSA